MVESIAVVITCYNLERYIAEAIRSVLAQEPGIPYEVIVVDDCSTDGSAAAVVAQFPQVRLLRTPTNGGVLQATVLGLQESKRDIVAFLDGDDVWHPEKLKKIVARFNQNPRLGLVTHDLRYIDEHGALLPRTSRPSQVMPTDAAPAVRDKLIRDGILEQGDYVWLGSAYAIRPLVVDAAGFCKFVETLPDARNTYQDWPLAVWCAAQPGVGVDYVPEKLFDYRLHGANHSGDARTREKSIRNINRTLNTMFAIEDIVRRFGPVPCRARRAINRKRRYYQYILDLYRDRRFVAFCGFLRSQPYVWRGDVSAAKEYARFAAVQLLGMDAFVKRLGNR